MMMSLAFCLAACDKEIETESGRDQGISIDQPVSSGNEEQIEEVVEEELETKVIEFDLDLKADLIIESDVIEFKKDVLVYTNGYRLEIAASSIILNNTRIFGYRSFSSGCDQHGKSPKDVYLNAKSLTGNIILDLKGTNAGNHCRVNYGIIFGASGCPKDLRSSKKCLKYFRGLAAFNGGNSGRLIYNNSTDIENLEIDFNEAVSKGSPATRMRFNHTIKRTVPKGKNGAKMPICVNFNEVVMCE